MSQNLTLVERAQIAASAAISSAIKVAADKDYISGIYQRIQSYKIPSINSTKEAIRQVLIGKGLQCPSSVSFSDYTRLIDNNLYSDKMWQKYYQCTSANTDLKLWAGHPISWSPSISSWVKWQGVIPNLPYKGFVPEIGKIYNTDTRLIISALSAFYNYPISGNEQTSGNSQASGAASSSTIIGFILAGCGDSDVNGDYYTNTYNGNIAYKKNLGYDDMWGEDVYMIIYYDPDQNYIDGQGWIIYHESAGIANFINTTAGSNATLQEVAQGPWTTMGYITPPVFSEYIYEDVSSGNTQNPSSELSGNGSMSGQTSGINELPTVDNVYRFTITGDLGYTGTYTLENVDVAGTNRRWIGPSGYSAINQEDWYQYMYYDSQFNNCWVIGISNVGYSVDNNAVFTRSENPFAASAVWYDGSAWGEGNMQIEENVQFTINEYISDNTSSIIISQPNGDLPVSGQPWPEGVAVGLRISNASYASFNGEYTLLNNASTGSNRVFYREDQNTMPYQISYDSGAFLPDNKPNAPQQGWVIKDTQDVRWYANVSADATIEQIAAATWVCYYSDGAVPTITVLYEHELV